MIINFVASLIASLILSMSAQAGTGFECSIVRTNPLNPVRTEMPALLPLGTSINGDTVSGYYHDAGTGCWAYLLRIGGNVATERYWAVR